MCACVHACVWGMHVHVYFQSTHVSKKFSGLKSNQYEHSISSFNPNTYLTVNFPDTELTMGRVGGNALQK